MSTAVFPGSFDPVTTGHVDLICRASRMFDRLVVGVEMLQEIVKDQDNITVCSFEGLLVDFVRQQKADAIIRGLRSSGDFEYELPLAQANYKMNQNADTVFLATAPEYSYISSSAVRELLRYQADISEYVPETVLHYMKEQGMVSR